MDKILLKLTEARNAIQSMFFLLMQVAFGENTNSVGSPLRKIFTKLSPKIHRHKEESDFHGEESVYLTGYLTGDINGNGRCEETIRIRKQINFDPERSRIKVAYELQVKLLVVTDNESMPGLTSLLSSKDE